MQRSKKLFIAEISRTGSRRCSGSDTKEFVDDGDKHAYTTARLSEFIDGAHNRCKNSHQKPSYSTW